MTKGAFKNIDLITLAIYFFLACFGIIIIHSSVLVEESSSIFSLSSSSGRQIMWGGISLFFGVVIFLLDKDFFNKNAPIFYGITTLLLVLVLVVGQERNGAKAWFGVGSFGIQPAEFCKITVSLMIAKYLSTSTSSIRKRETQIKILGIIFLPIMLIMLQPDLGTVLVFSAFILVLYREGISGNILLYGILLFIITIMSLILHESTNTMFGFTFSSLYVLAGLIILIASLLFFIVYRFIYKRYRRQLIIRLITITTIALIIIPSVVTLFNKIPPTNYQRKRIEIVLGLREDPKGVGYNIHQALSAIGSGELTGKGYMNATLANSRYRQVPEQSTDFIFCTIGEEWGFIGGAILFTLFLTLILRIIIIAERQRSSFTRIYAYSVGCILFLHFTINIGMVMGIAPIIGIPLPFFSYGGSSLLAFSIMLFILLKLDADRLEVFG